MTTDTTSIAIDYVRRGWAVIPLHDVSSGACSCGSADPVHVYRQGGKHPLDGRWHERALRTESEVRETWAGRPGANVGIVTGAASGVWVLDVDPDNGGHAHLAALVAAYGVLPDTYTVTTGSGGMHYYWSLPDWEPTNSRGRLPIGLDVRGWHGQVVAPPSASAKGPYRVGSSAPVAPAPAWLLDMIRPVAPTPPPSRDERPTFGPAGDDSDRGASYARAAVGGALTELGNAMQGERNDTAFRVACRLAELVNADWSKLDSDHVFEEYQTAASLANVDGTFSEREALDVLNKAIRHVAGRAAELPPPEHLGTFVPWDALPAHVADFSAAGQGPATAHHFPPGTPFTNPGNSPANSGLSGISPAYSTTATAHGGESPTAAVDPFEQWVAKEMWSQRVRTAARERLEAERAPDVGAGADAILAELLDGEGLAALPEPDPLIGGWLSRDTLARVYGPSGHGKSFVVLDMAACVASGRPWHGRPVQRAGVVYGLAEGVAGMAKRAAAWSERHGVEHGVLFLPRAVQIMSPEWPAFVEAMRRRAPGLIILDTQARSTAGRNENDNSDMSEVVARLDELRMATGACVLLVHHKGLNGEQARGASAVKGAMDVEHDVTRVGTRITVRNGKQKDDAESEPLELDMVPMGRSIVLVRDGESLADPGSPFMSPARAVDTSAERALALVSVLIDNFTHGNGGSTADARALFYAHRAIHELPQSHKRKAFVRAWGKLESLGRIAKTRGTQRFKFIPLDQLDPLDRNPDMLAPSGWILSENTYAGT